MKISIVTLSFNQEAFLREALESVLQQEYPQLEYIVVDPGSTDGSRELIQSYSTRIAHAIFEPDQGAADGLNKGFSKATGDIFGFLNADDVLMPGSLQRVADFFCLNPHCDLALGNGFKIDENGRQLRHFRARNFTAQTYFYGGAQWLQQSSFFRSVLYRRSSGFNVQNRTCWDGEFFVTQLSQGARVGYLDADLAAFRIHPDSISGSGRMQKQYEEDSRRIFRQTKGRDWRATDELWRLLYRSTAYLARAGSR